MLLFRYKHIFISSRKHFYSKQYTLILVNTGIKRQVRRNAIFHRKRKNQPKESSLWTTKRRTFKTSQKTFNVICYYIFYIVGEHMLHICSTHTYFFVQKNNCFNKQSQGDILSTALLKPQAINGPYFLLFSLPYQRQSNCYQAYLLI